MLFLRILRPPLDFLHLLPSPRPLCNLYIAIMCITCSSRMSQRGIEIKCDTVHYLAMCVNPTHWRVCSSHPLKRYDISYNTRIILPDIVRRVEVDGVLNQVLFLFLCFVVFCCWYSWKLSCRVHKRQ